MQSPNTSSVWKGIVQCMDTYDNILVPTRRPQDGMIVTAEYGAGTYTYNTVVWYRQIQGLVPGPYRLLTNIISQSFGNITGAPIDAYNAAFDEFCSYYDTATWRFLKENLADYTAASVSAAELIMNTAGGAHAALLTAQGKLAAGRLDAADSAAALEEWAAILSGAVTDMKAALVLKGAATVVSATPAAYVMKMDVDLYYLTIFVVEKMSDGTINVRLNSARVGTNAVGTYPVGPYNVFVDIKNNVQVRACYFA